MRLPGASESESLSSQSRAQASSAMTCSSSVGSQHKGRGEAKPTPRTRSSWECCRTRAAKAALLAPGALDTRASTKAHIARLRVKMLSTSRIRGAGSPASRASRRALSACLPGSTRAPGGETGLWQRAQQQDWGAERIKWREIHRLQKEWPQGVVTASTIHRSQMPQLATCWTDSRSCGCRGLGSPRVGNRAVSLPELPSCSSKARALAGLELAAREDQRTMRLRFGKPSSACALGWQED